MAVKLEERCQNLLYKLLNAESYLKIDTIATEQRASKRSIYYDISKINEFLNMNQIENIQLRRSKGVYLEGTQKEKIRELLKGKQNPISLWYTPVQREEIILCLLLVTAKTLFIGDFTQTCQISRNTTIKDLKNVKNKLKDYDLSLIYEAKRGYYIKGDTIVKRALFFLYFPILPTTFKRELLLDNEVLVNEYLDKLRKIENELDTKYVLETLETMAYFLLFFPGKKEKLYFKKNDEQNVSCSIEYKLVQKYFIGMEKNEQVYLALHLLGSRLQTVPLKTNDKLEEMEAYTFAEGLVGEFCRISCIEFEDEAQLIQNIFIHLRSSLYRYKYGIQIGNPLVLEIKAQYSELFNITKKAVEYLEVKLGLPINDSEVAYLTLHFGASINPEINDEDMKILIVCPNGISTGNMLRGEVAALVPYADEIKVVPMSEYYALRKQFQVVISTVNLNDFQNYILVHPILTDNDRISILKKCMRSESKLRVDIEELFQILSSYIPEAKKNEAKKEVTNYLNQNYDLEYRTFSDQRGIISFLKTEFILFFSKIYTWEDALVEAAQPLIKEKAIDEKYVDAMIHQTNLMGPYMFITPEVVLAHAKTSDGVNHLGFSLSLFNTPVKFPKNKAASIIIVLAPEDQVKHIKILQDIMTFFSDSKNTVKLRACHHYEEVLAVAKGVLCAD